MCPYIAASIAIRDPQHPARQYARDYKKAFAARLAETAHETGAANPEQLGEQLALLLDRASARTRVLNTESFPTAAAAIAAVLIDNAIPAPSPRQPGDELGTVNTAALSHVETFRRRGQVVHHTQVHAGVASSESRVSQSPRQQGARTAPQARWLSTRISPETEACVLMACKPLAQGELARYTDLVG